MIDQRSFQQSVQQSVQNLINIRYFFSSDRGHLRQAAAMMLADRIIPGMHEVMNDKLVGDREMDHSYRIFLALEREHA